MDLIYGPVALSLGGNGNELDHEYSERFVRLSKLFRMVWR